MSALATFTDRLKSQLQISLGLAKRQIFGANNEKLDFLMDSFYKLSPNQRTGVLAGGIVGVFLVVVMIFGLYFSLVNGLKSDLSQSFAALHELQSKKAMYEQENRNFEKLADTLERKTKQVSLKPFFEKIANEQSVTLEGLSDSQSPLPADNPLSDRIKEVRVEMRMPNISIPRLLSFLVEVEKSNKYLRVQDLQIRARYGTKLYFDAQSKVRGYDSNK
ncbi:MAG: hypothetical protein FJ146_09700 [Deltaproteobacteria bacterium]|nr:hypothetical protein [Deltaproteobacteria bacterium]